MPFGSKLVVAAFVVTTHVKSMSYRMYFEVLEVLALHMVQVKVYQCDCIVHVFKIIQMCTVSAMV